MYYITKLYTWHLICRIWTGWLLKRLCKFFMWTTHILSSTTKFLFILLFIATPLYIHLFIRLLKLEPESEFHTINMQM